MEIITISKLVELHKETFLDSSQNNSYLGCKMSKLKQGFQNSLRLFSSSHQCRLFLFPFHAAICLNDERALSTTMNV